jgi:hypothetical protein
MLCRALPTALVALLLAAPGGAKIIYLPYAPQQKAVLADVVVLGKVSAVEKDTVDAEPVAGAQKQTYKVAVIKVESGLVGAANATHVRAAFLAPPPVDPAAPLRFGPEPVRLAEGQEGLFFLIRHHGGSFLVIDPLLAPLDTSAADYKDQLAVVKRVASVIAEPVKALKAEKAADRFFAATLLLNKYRTSITDARALGTKKLPAEESQLILKALAEGNWSDNGYQAFGLLDLTEKDGFRPPRPGPNENFVEKYKDAYVKWLDGPGKEYRVSKLVPKKK